MRIYVIEASGKGGFIHYSYHLCRALQRAGADVTLVTSVHYELDNLPHDFQVEKMQYLSDLCQNQDENPAWHALRWVRHRVRDILEWLRLVRYLRREKPDYIVFGEIRSGLEFYFLKLLKSSGLKLAGIVHDVQRYDTFGESDVILETSRSHLRHDNRVYKTFDTLFVHDRTNRELFLSLYDVPAERVIVIPQGTNEIMLEIQPSHTPEQLAYELNIALDRQIVLFFGTVTKYKGIEDLLQAFPAVTEATNALLVVAGAPAKDIDPDALQALAAELGITNDVVWYLEYVPNAQVTALMALSDVVVFPYRAITQSAVIQIAYACGRPVIASRIGGLIDVVEEGKSGFLVEPHNPNALADTIIRLLDDSDLAAQMSRQAITLAQTRYAWSHVAEKVLAALS